MKKNFLTLFMILMFAIPAFATDPDIDTATASCDDGVFNSNTGPVNIEVNWEPNEINLRWYNNNTLITPSDSASNTCTYDENGLTIPAAPTRTGYTFRGWRARQEMDIRNLGSGMTYQYGYIRATTDCAELPASGTYLTQVCSGANYRDLAAEEWKVIADIGTVYGISKISSTHGDSAERQNTLADPTGDTGYCWCKVTGFIPTGENTLYRPIHSMPWVTIGDATLNVRGCTHYCVMRTRQRYAFRTSLFKPL